MEATEEQIQALVEFKRQFGNTWLHVLMNMSITGDLKRHPNGKLLSDLLHLLGITGIATL